MKTDGLTNFFDEPPAGHCLLSRRFVQPEDFAPGGNNTMGNKKVKTLRYRDYYHTFLAMSDESALGDDQYSSSGQSRGARLR